MILATNVKTVAVGELNTSVHNIHGIYHKNVGALPVPDLVTGLDLQLVCTVSEILSSRMKSVSYHQQSIGKRGYEPMCGTPVQS